MRGRLALPASQEPLTTGLLDMLVHAWQALRRNSNIDVARKAHALFRRCCRRIHYSFACGGLFPRPKLANSSAGAQRASVLRVLFYSLTVPAETRFFLFGASNYSRCEKLLELYSPHGPPALVPSIIYSLLLGYG